MTPLKFSKDLIHPEPFITLEHFNDVSLFSVIKLNHIGR